MAALAPRYRDVGIELEVVHLRASVFSVVDEFLAAGATSSFVDLDELGRPRAAEALTRLIRDRRPDLVHTTLFEADVLGRVAARLAGTPVVSSIVNESYGPEHASDPGVRMSRLRAAQALDATTARLCRRMHALTSHAADTMARRLRYPRARIDVVGRGRDPQVLGSRSEGRRSRVRSSLGIDEAQPVVLAAARQEYQKGLDVLLRSLPMLIEQQIDLRVLVAGREGNETGRLQALVSELGLADRVTFLGGRDDVPDLMVAADVLVVPSRREGFGSVLLEAMALETLIVASDLSPIREVLGDDAAGLVTPENPVALAAEIARILRDPTGSRRRTDAARRRFDQRFTTSAIGDEMLAFYERALGR
jgi:glycosyltransferase involved in cell wall biosynthesis